MIFSDAGVLLFFAFLPLAYPIIYSLIYNPELVRDVKLVVVDHDRTSRSRELVRNIDATQEAWVVGYAANLGEAKRAMHEQDCYGILEIPQGFERKIGQGESSNAVLYCEMSLLLRYRSLLMASTNVALEMGATIQSEKLDGTVPLAATLSTGDPLRVSNINMGNIEGGFDSFIMPGVLILILHQCIILSVGMMGGATHENPSKIGYDPINEARSIPLTMLGKMLCYMTIMLLPTIFLVHYVPLMFAFPMAGDFWEILTFLTPMVIACIMLGFCLQAFVWEREAIFVLWVVTSVVFLFLSGLIWPIYAMPEVWHFLSDCIPATWGVEGFIRMNANGASLAQVHTDYTSLWILAAVYSVLAYCLHRWVVRPSLGINMIHDRKILRRQQNS